MKKLQYLEGLRGLAAFVVVLHHLRLTFFIDITDSIHNQLIEHIPELISKILISAFDKLFDGTLAVYIFWLMSAYVISIKLFSLSKSESLIYLKKGALKRYFRLFILVLGSVLLVYFLMFFGLMRNFELADRLNELTSNAWIGSFFVIDSSFLEMLKFTFWDVFFNYNEAHTFNAVLWTMSKELYGSLFCFGMYLISGRRKYRFVFYLAIIAVLLMLTKAWLLCFVLGFMLADYDHSSDQNRIWQFFRTLETKILSYEIILLVVFLSLTAVGDRLLLKVGVPYSGVNTLLSIWILYFVIRLNSLRRFFRNRVLVWLGKMSFSLYLVHFPIIASIGSWTYLSIDNHLLAVIIACLVSIAVSIAVSVLFYRIFDKPSIKYSGIIGSKLNHRLKFA